MTPTPAQKLAPALAPLLLHPATPLAESALLVARLVDGVSPKAAESLLAFAQAVLPLGIDGQQELHTRTFDLSPVCAPYLSVHLFGDESYKRAELMTGLASAYDRAPHDPSLELPDHLAVVLAFAPEFSGEEWTDLGRYCLPAALASMRRALAGADNPYAPLLDAVSQLLATDFPGLMEVRPCSTSSYLQRFLTSPSSPSSAGACGGCVPTPSATLPCPPSSSRAAG